MVRPVCSPLSLTARPSSTLVSWLAAVVVCCGGVEVAAQQEASPRSQRSADFVAASGARASVEDADGALVVLVDQGSGLRWSQAWLAVAAQASDRPVRYGALEAWPGEPPEEDLKAAAAAYERGVQAFLALDTRAANSAFGKASAAYEAILEAYPFHVESYEGMGRSVFYRAWTMMEGRQRGQARQVLRKLLLNHPALEPDPGVFPPAFRQEVEQARAHAERGRRRHVTLELTLAQPGAVVSVEGQQRQPDERGQVSLTLSPGERELVVGLPGFAVVRQVVDLQKSVQRRVDLLAWPALLPQTASGRPAERALLSALKSEGAEALIWVTDGEAVGVSGQVAYLHRMIDGRLVGAVALPRSATPESLGVLASLMSQALGSAELETWLVSEDGEAISDGDLRDDILALSGVKVDVADDLTPPIRQAPPRWWLALSAGSGAGLATQVSNPGLAPTLLVVRPELAYRLSSVVELGVAARLQAVNFAAMGEPYLRWRLPGVRLRLGVGIGEVTHEILDTDNRNTSTQGIVGPVLGLEVPLGPVHIGASVIAPLFPDPTVHGDLLLGFGFEL